MTVEDKRVLVMGAARSTGVGRALVHRLAKRGARLVISDSVATGTDAASGTSHVSEELLEMIGEEASELSGHRVPVIPVDPLNQGEVAGLITASVEHLGQLDALCNNVGATGSAYGDGPLVDVTLDGWTAGMAWNATTAWIAAREAAAAMSKSGGGSIALLSSYAGIDPTPRSGVVGIGRAAVNQMVRVLARELGPMNIRVNSICPLGIRDDLGDELLNNPGLSKLANAEGLSLQEWLATRIPLGRGQSPDEMAAVFEFLVSDMSSFISGVAMPVAGGAPA